jgi:uncharacterized protein with FMN-binding domain
VKRISFWVLSTLSAVVLLVGFDASQHGGSVTATGPLTSGGTTSGSGSSSGSGQGSGNGGGNGGGNGNGNGNGGSGGTSGSGSGNGTQSGSGSTTTATTVTGAVAQTIWGPVQVQLKVKSGTITEVKILQYPSGNSRDVELAQYALPILMRETTQAQSAQIDMVSGATYTSQGYLQSLQSALDQANL